MVKEAQKGITHFSLLRMEQNWNFLTIGRKLNIEKPNSGGIFPQEEISKQQLGLHTIFFILVLIVNYGTPLLN